jgi:mono/diheme cytochrome c family protein
VSHRSWPSFPRLVLVLPLASGLALACGPGGEGDTRAAAPAAPAAPAAAPAAADGEALRKEAEQIFATRCFTCHGPAGAGDGPASAGLTPQPRNLQEPAWQASVNDEHIEQIILYGGAAVGLSPAMPANPDLMSKPETVTALREVVRGLAKP